MKKMIILFAIVFFTKNLSAQQNEPCTYYGIQESINARMSNFNNHDLIIDNPLTPMVFNIKINIFNRENGTNWCTRNNIAFGDQQFQEIVKDLNINFNQFNIFFKYKGFQIYGGDDGNGNLTMIENSTDNINGIYARQNQMVDLCEKDVINLNFVDQLLTPFNTITNELQHTYQYVKAIASIGRPILIFSLPSYFGVRSVGNGSEQDFRFDKNFVVCHEMGHTLGLHHIFENFKQPTNPIYPTFISENVSRNPTDALFNANIAGDMITDTPAVGNFPPWIYDTDICQAQPNPTFMSENVDINGTYLDFENIKYGNFMSYSYDDVGTSFNHTGCLGISNSTKNYTFTAGQGAFMRNYILNNVPAALVVGNTGILTVNITQAITSVGSLYKPYERLKIISQNILSTTDNGNGTAKVCRGYTEQFKFQMGFNYQFPENQSPDLFNYTIIEIPNISLPAFNCPVVIAQLVPGLTNLTTNLGEAETICRGQVCTDEAFIGGIVLSTEELLDMNVTIEQLNTIQVKDPELFDRLLSQRYYKLKKETSSGAKTESVFYKP